VFVLGVATLSAFGSHARADATKFADTSLKFVPADAAFYSTSLRLKEQFDLFLQSKAWKKLNELPLAKKAWQQLDAEWKKDDSDLAKIRKVYELAENKQLVELLIDMASHELFVCGSANVNELLSIIMQANTAMQWAPLGDLLAGKIGEDPSKAQLGGFLRGLDQHRDKLRIPDFLIGFKLSQRDKADAQLKRLEEFLKPLTDSYHVTKGKLKRVKISGNDYLTLTLDAKHLPWDDISFAEYEREQGEFDKLRSKLATMTLTATLGVRDGYLLLSLGEASDLIGKLGNGRSLLELPELKPVLAHADKKLLDVVYASKATRTLGATTKKDVDNFLTAGLEQLKKESMQAVGAW
jgi:hypothetical protein